MKYNKGMTTNHGAPVINDDNGMTIGESGPIVMGDYWFVEKISHFNREKIPERMMFCKGVGAHGYFEAMESMGDYTRARFLSKKGTRTPVFVKFSMMFSEKGTPDTARDVRGMEVKFYTEEGNFDLLSTSFPVNPIRDAMCLPDLIHARKAAPHTGIVEMERFFDFYSCKPEMTNWLVRYYSDQGTRKSYRKTPYYGMGTYLFDGGSENKFYVRFRLLPLEGEEVITWEEAKELAATEPDVAGKDFYETLYQDKTIEFQVCIQIRRADGKRGGSDKEEDALDGTKVWDESLYPVYGIGRLVINRPPQNHFAEVEQSAFSVSQCVPGIYISPDRFMQGLAFMGADQNRYRLGINYMQLPINSPKIPVINNHQDGAMRYYANGGRVNYKPNLLVRDEPRVGLEYRNAYPEYYHGYVQRMPVRSEDDFKQAFGFYHSLRKEGQEAIHKNLSRDLQGVDETIRETVRSFLESVDGNFKDL